jgi:hypothetical protein
MNIDYAWYNTNEMDMTLRLLTVHEYENMVMDDGGSEDD